ncbi:MAG: glutamine--fructose-6-phosphate transaminase (isomerizing) [Candidatus Thermoplasmatota archaeon]|nr:glutamine--fructose-6-phosphate transaminase (isomerizing) [Candidatus Thermoplasmatota archaeon]
MCGIIGYNGYRNAQPVILDGLKRLEYRGYDSAGIGIINKKLQVHKQVGDISRLIDSIPSFTGTIGIGHTRWATHGKVTETNAHPQLNTSKTIAIVHNGIIDNFLELKNHLQQKGYVFQSQTDSEIIAHLIDEHYHKDFQDAILKTIRQLRGSYAIVAISQKDPDTIIAARNESPLVIGIGDNENLVASDIPALLKYTNRVIYLDDGEICILKKKSVTILDSAGTQKQKETHLVTWDVRDAEKAGYPHFMLKEIHEQPQALTQGLVGRISEINRTVSFHEKIERLLRKPIQKIHLIACGTSFYACYIGKYLFEQLTNIPVQIDLASEYRYFSPKQPDAFVIAVTQSGETLDTLGALRTAKKTGCQTLVITNVIGSTATRIANAYLLTQSGPEIGVAATKTFTSQILMLYLLALKIASNQQTISSDDLYHTLIELRELPREVRQILHQTEEIKTLAHNISNSTSLFYIGRGINYPLALEGALKIKEISYIHAEGFAAGELKHGPFALLSPETPVIAIATHDKIFDKMLANIGEIKARGAPVIVITDDPTNLADQVDHVFTCSCQSKHLSCIPIAVVLQLLAYHVASIRNCPIDKPRNLAKSVTVD